jgi:multidrug resistance efflux pump
MHYSNACAVSHCVRKCRRHAGALEEAKADLMAVLALDAANAAARKELAAVKDAVKAAKAKEKAAFGGIFGKVSVTLQNRLRLERSAQQPPGRDAAGTLVFRLC